MRASLAGAVWFYTRRSVANRTRVQLRRLRSPRALIALAAGGAYLYWFLVRPAREDGVDVGVGLTATPAAPTLAALALTVLAAAWWLGRPAGGDGRGGAGPSRALAFTPAEEHLLFPAPITRRGLVRWKLWRAQIGVLLNTLLWTVILRGAGGEPAAWRRAGALWVMLSVVLLHRTGAALVTGGQQARASALADAAADAWSNTGVSQQRAKWRLHVAQLAPAFVFLALAGALLAGVAREQARLAVAWDVGIGRFTRVLARAFDAPAAHVALAPARLVVAPLFAAAEGADVWVRAIGPALLVLALHYLWVLRTDAAVQELGLAAGVRRRAERAGVRSRAPADTLVDAPVREGATAVAPRVRRRAPRLEPRGWPAGALVWKNLVAAARAVALARLLAFYAVVAAGMLVIAARTPRLAEVAGVVAGVWGAMLVLAGPTWVRVDLRHDLVHLPFLRAAPLRGRDVVAAEVAASTIALTALQFAAFGLLLVASLGARDGFGLSGEERAAGALAGALALPGVNAALLTVQNAAALLFPAWVRPPGSGPRGIESMGQNLVLTALTLAAAAVILAPAGAVGAAAWWGATRLAGRLDAPWAFAPGALAGTLVTLALLAPVVAWLGRVFDRTDPPAGETNA